MLRLNLAAALLLLSPLLHAADHPPILEPNQPLTLRIPIDNLAPAGATLPLRYSIQANPAYADPPLPHPTLGIDHAAGAATTLTVAGRPQGDSRLCDNDDHSAFEFPWGLNATEVFATIDLAQPRDLTAIHWIAGDANWVFKVDLSTSLDGESFQPIPTAQAVDLHGKWGGPHPFPLPDTPIRARYLRLRFHDAGKPMVCLRLPPTLRIYDGIANDRIALPRVGPILASGPAAATVRDNHAELTLPDTRSLSPGAYLVTLELTLPSRTLSHWSHCFILPADTVPPDAARRFGINGSTSRLAPILRRCGFGWMRFENGKWIMYMPARDRAAFDGSVAPWHLNFDQIFTDYQRANLLVLPYVFQTPDWATAAPPDVKTNRAGYPPKNPADYGDAVFQLVARYGKATVDPALLKTADRKSGLNLIHAVELWNEPNLTDASWGPFVGPMSLYFENLRAGAEASRRADPSLPVSAAGLAGLDLEVVGQLAEYRYPDGKIPLDLVDIINVHFYSGRDEPETATSDPNVHRAGPPPAGSTYPDQLEDLVDWRNRLKPAARIWLTETGNDVGGPIGRTERYQAAKLPRAVILALAAGVERVFIYRETGSTPAMHAGAGLIRDDGTLRPSFLTVATMIRQMQGLDGPALRLPSTDPNLWMFLWQQADRRLLIAWTLGQPRPLGIDLGPARACDGFGRAESLPATADLLLSDVPTYLTLTQPTPALQQLISTAQANARQRADHRRRVAQLPMMLFDFGPAEHVGMLRGFGPPRRFTPISKDLAWNPDRGYGFSTAAISNEDARWIADALERDGCRFSPNTRFRFRIPSTPHRLRFRATPFFPDQPVEILLRAGDAVHRQTVTPDHPIAEFTLTPTDAPLELTVTRDAILRWLSAIPQSAYQDAP